MSIEKKDAPKAFRRLSIAIVLGLLILLAQLFIQILQLTGGNSSNPVTESKMFTYTGAISSWKVPARVTSITITAIGGKGGTGNQEQSSGAAGLAMGTLPVHAGVTYFFCVGSNGGSTGSASDAGFCGGGAPGTGNSGSNRAGGGGGMTWFGPDSSFNPNTVIIVAGGGGGSGQSVGGAAGGTNGSAAGNVDSCDGGGGGTQTTGGAQGVGDTPSSGGEGQGGIGGVSGDAPGGGGGGGFFGGAGGGAIGNICFAGGGGGSSFLGSSLVGTNTASAANVGNGSLTITYTIQ